MNIASVALAGTYSTILSLLGLDTSGPIGLSLSVGQTVNDTFELYGTLDVAAVDNTNAFLISTFTGGAQNLPASIADAAKAWPYLLIRRTGGSTAGTFIVAGNPASSPAPVSVAAPVGIGVYSGLMTLSTLGALNIRFSGSTAMVVGDSFDVYCSNDATLASSVGSFYAGRIYGGGGPNVNQNLKVSGYNYAIIKRVTGTTAGTIIAAGISPSASGGVQTLPTLAVGDTAATGFMGGLSAAASVDQYSVFQVNQTTAAVVLSLRNPTNTGATRFAWITNVGAVLTYAYGQGIPAGTTAEFFWNGTIWESTNAIANGGNTGAVTAGSLDNTAALIGTTVTVGGTVGAAAVLIQSGTGGITQTGSQIHTAAATVADGTGSLGLPGVTVNVASLLLVNQTTPVVLYANMRTIPAPSVATAGRKLTICNIGTAAFIVGDATQKQGINLIPGTTPGGAASANKGQSCDFTWNGTAWVPDCDGPGVPVVAAALADAAASIPRAGRYTVYRAATWTGANALTASLTGALIGDIIDVVRDDGTQAVTMTVNNAAGAALAVGPASKKATFRIAYLGTGDWQLLGGGAF
jgi:hypothetical protein